MVHGGIVADGPNKHAKDIEQHPIRVAMIGNRSKHT